MPVWDHWLSEEHSLPLPICADVGHWVRLLRGDFKIILQVKPTQCWKLAKKTVSDQAPGASSSSQPPAVARSVMFSDQVDAAPAEKKKKQCARPRWWCSVQHPKRKPVQWCSVQHPTTQPIQHPEEQPVPPRARAPVFSFQFRSRPHPHLPLHLQLWTRRPLAR